MLMKSKRMVWLPSLPYGIMAEVKCRSQRRFVQDFPNIHCPNQNGSPLMETISRIILFLQEMGILCLIESQMSMELYIIGERK